MSDLEFKQLFQKFQDDFGEELNHEQITFLVNLLKNAIDFLIHKDDFGDNIPLDYQERMITDIYKFNTIVPQMPQYYQHYLLQGIKISLHSQQNLY